MAQQAVDLAAVVGGVVDHVENREADRRLLGLPGDGAIDEGLFKGGGVEN